MMKRSTATSNSKSTDDDDRPSTLQRPTRRPLNRRKTSQKRTPLAVLWLVIITVLILVGVVFYVFRQVHTNKHENLILHKKSHESLLRQQNAPPSSSHHEKILRKQPHEDPANDLHKPAQQLPQHQLPQQQPQQHTRFVMELGGLITNSTTTGTTGRVILETRSDWAPIGVEHFHTLMEHNYYQDCRFFRTVPNFVVQFGIAADPRDPLKQTYAKPLKDDPVLHSNDYGTITYATSGKNTRRFQLFINTNPKGNAYLDKEGFAPFARIVEGMEYVERINHRHRQKPNQGKIQNRGNQYLQEEFPDLSYITSIHKLPQQQ